MFKLKDIRKEANKYRFKSQWTEVSTIIRTGIKQRKRGKKS